MRLFTAQLVTVLEYLQTHQIMHRDLKPQNIMLDENYYIKVIDFGDAKKENEEPLEDDPPQDSGANNATEANGEGADFADDMMSMHSDASSGMDRRGTLVGTMNYLAPEMIQSQNATKSTDLWALGCIIFKMVTGQVPFTGT